MTEKVKIPEPVKKPIRCPLCRAVFDVKYLPLRDHAPALFCHFCQIVIMANDPFVDRWEEAYSKGEKVYCPACEYRGDKQEMRFFATATGYVQFKCPRKKCQAKMESMAPDRKKDEKLLLDKEGNPIQLPNVNKPIATPDDPGLLQ
jgi:hypothetical protein